MGLRDTVAAALSRPAGRVIDAPVRELVEQILASRDYVQPGELAALRRELAELRQAQGGLEAEADEASQAAEMAIEVASLSEEVASLKKKVNMAMGAIQAATAQLMGVKNDAEAATGAAQRAAQAAVSARSTAESAAEGVSSMEAAIARLEAALQGGGLAQPASAAHTESPETSEVPQNGDRHEDDRGCDVPGCRNKHRARGFCARHYQQQRRGVLENFVGPENTVIVGDHTWTVPDGHEGEYADVVGGWLHVGGTRQDAAHRN